MTQHRENQQLWIQGVIVSLAVIVSFSVYLYLRRGYYNLYILNKVLGSSAALLAGFTLVLGPLSKRIHSLTPYAAIRKQMGLIALYLALSHMGASLVQQEKFVFPSWYIAEWVPILFGSIAVTVWLYMKGISHPSSIKKIGLKAWGYRLSLAGKVSFLAIFFHLVVMKYPGWWKWMNGQVNASPELKNPAYPPASLLLFFVLLTIIIYRIYADYIIGKKH